MSLESVAERLLAELVATHPLGYTPKLVWRPYRVTAGIAYYRIGVIGLSPLVLRDEQSVRDTLRHEYAHLMAVVRYGPKAAGHGPAWQAAMRELGMEPKVRHNYEVERNQRRQKVTYKCLRCDKRFERARRLPRKKHYVHAGCGGELRLVSVVRVTGGGNVA